MKHLGTRTQELRALSDSPGKQNEMKRQQLILVVDDDREMLRMLNRTLELEGYGVDIAADGRAALALLEERRPDLVILDIVMPELDGFQVLDLIRQRSNVPVIMLSARCEVTTVRDVLILGADDYVRKPFGTRELLARIQTKLRRAEQRVPHPKKAVEGARNKEGEVDK